MHPQLTEEFIDSLRSAASRLTGYRRRAFQAEMTEKYCDNSARRAERVFGWGRVAVETGLHERRTGIRCVECFRQRGRRKSEEVDDQLEEDIREIVEPLSQADPKFQSTLAFTRATAPAVKAALEQKRNGSGQAVPSRRTLVNILNRMGYCLRRVQKTRPEKKSPRPTPFSPASTPLTSGQRQTRRV